ncbi:MAG: methylated-DNA--[protein]-cysteine S-methyltransferase [Chitinophagales bacterium]|nr:methylated-DNA--[protein]-cysteine S-methyltransferase [Bacteroidota bacterium]
MHRINFVEITPNDRQNIQQYSLSLAWGNLFVCANEKALSAISFSPEANFTLRETDKFFPQEVANFYAQIKDYFAGELQHFSLNLFRVGTPYQQKVWELLLQIPYGSTCSYVQLAEQLQDAQHIRAVARANATNPFAIVVPCHRVIGKNGQLVGYAGGLEWKQKLLALEKAQFQGRLF